MKNLFFLILLMLFFGGCYYDSAENLYPDLGSSCDTTNVTYSTRIVPILNDNCLSCHGNSTFESGGGIKLENYSDLKIQINNGRLYNAITHQGPIVMPPSGQLDNCSIKKIKIWIDAGAPNN